MNDQASCTIDVAYGDTRPAGLPVVVGVPAPRGVLSEAHDALTVTAPGGEQRPAGVRPLVRWPDGSIRWCLVDFGAREPGTHRIDWQPAGAPAAAPRVTLTHQADTWTITSDRLRLSVCETGPGVLGDLACDGHNYLAEPGHLRLSVDDASTLHENRRTVRVLEASARRVRLRVEGAHHRPDGNRRLHYRLDIEVWAGWPTVRLDYHYFNLEPHQPSQRIERIALDSAWNLGEQTHRHFLQRNYGLFYVSRHVLNSAPVAISSLENHPAPHVDDPAMLLDDVDYPFYLNPPLVNTHDWLGVGDAQHAVYMSIADFARSVPNRLASDANTLSAELWPATAAMLDLPQGRSRRQTLSLSFVTGEAPETGTAKLSGAPTQAPKGVAALLAAPLHEGRACVGAQWYAHCREFRQAYALPAAQHVRIETNLRDLVRLDMPITKFDVGDTDSHYNTGRSHRPLPGAPLIPRRFPRSTPTQTYLDLTEPVWTNNEYDVIHVFCKEIMRTGRFELWPTLRLAARHNIEVDFLHYSDHKWLHRATPAHSVHHTTTGAYPSHFWTQGLLEYYCLTGDVDALEVAEALGDKAIENLSDPELRKVQWGFNREIGWAVLLLACLVDITGEHRFKRQLDELVDYLIAFDRESYQGGINLSSGNDRQSLNRQIVNSFFGYASMLEGVDLYIDLTGRADVLDWLKRFCHDLADEALNAAREGQMRGIDFGTALGIGLERTGDHRFLELTGLSLDIAYWNAPGVQGGGSAKPVAYNYRGLARILGHAWRHGLLEDYEFPTLRRLRQSEVRDQSSEVENQAAFAGAAQRGLSDPSADP